MIRSRTRGDLRVYFLRSSLVVRLLPENRAADGQWRVVDVCFKRFGGSIEICMVPSFLVYLEHLESVEY